MNWYKEYRSEWKEIIETVARELGRTELMVSAIGFRVWPMVMVRQGVAPGRAMAASVVPMPLFSSAMG